MPRRDAGLQAITGTFGAAVAGDRVSAVSAGKIRRGDCLRVPYIGAVQAINPETAKPPRYWICGYALTAAKRSGVSIILILNPQLIED